MQDFDPAKASGEANYSRPSQLKLDEITINGQSGGFRIKRFTQDKNAEGKYPVEELGPKIEVAFISVRRRLVQRGKDGIVCSTSEHNHKDDLVALFQQGKPTEKGRASAFREIHQLLRTEQVVYCRYAGQLVRLRVKGASLGSETKSEDVTDFYKYLSSYNGGDHFYNFRTVISSVAEQGGLGSYYVMDFKRGERLTADQQDMIFDQMKEVYANTSKSDEYYGNAPMSEIAKAEEMAADDVSAADDGYPAEDINPDDIPF